MNELRGNHQSDVGFRMPIAVTSSCAFRTIIVDFYDACANFGFPVPLTEPRSLSILLCNLFASDVINPPLKLLLTPCRAPWTQNGRRGGNPSGETSCRVEQGLNEAGGVVQLDRLRLGVRALTV